MENDIGITQFLIYLRGSIKKMQKVFNEELKGYNITSSHLVYMILLKEYEDGLTMTELSNKSQVDKALTSRVVTELEKIEYIYRDRKDKHLRNYKICLTKKGLYVANSIEEIMSNNKKRMLDEFSTEEQEQIREVILMLMNKFYNNKEE